MLSPPLSPPGVAPRGPQRNMAKTAALKLVTSFGDKSTKSKFFGPDGDKTPMAGVGATPIAESALSPGATGSHTAFLRPKDRSVYNTPASARTATPGGFARARLPSIGEMPTDVTPIIRRLESRPTTDDDTSSEVSTSTNGSRFRRGHMRKSSGPETLQLASATYNPISRATTASPMMQKTAQTMNPLPSPSPAMFTLKQQDARTRNGSRDRKPDGLQIQWPPMESIITGDYMTTPELSATSSRHRTPTARSVAGSVAGSVSSMSSAGRSPLPSARSLRSNNIASPIEPGRSLDQYISSLDAAQHYQAKQRARKTTRDQDRTGRGRSSSRKATAREPSEDRGRSGIRYIKPAKRSPTSPVPMSPEDLRDMGAFGYDDDRSETASNYSDVRRTKTRDASQTTAKPGSKAGSRIRRMSPEPLVFPSISRPSSRLTSKNLSRNTSPDVSVSSRDPRGRHKAHDGSTIPSPSSPLPMSTEAKFYSRDVDNDEEDADLRAAKADQERFRSRHRSASRVRGTSSVRHTSPERRRRQRSSSRHGAGRDSSSQREDRKEHRAVSHTRSVSDLKAGDLHQIKTDRQRKKEAAARELEERRRSLVRRPSAPPVVHPDQLSPAFFRPASRTENLRSDFYQPPSMPPRSQTVSPESMRQASGRFQEPVRTTAVQVGLPATPRAMQHPKYDPDNKDIPDVPQIPESYNPIPQLTMGSLNEITYNNAFETLGPLPQTTFTPLPKTTYQAAPRHIPPRSMSAPIPEEPPLSPHALPAALPTHPAFQAALPPSTRRRNGDIEDRPQYSPSARKINPGESQPGTLGYEVRNNAPVYSQPVMMGGIDETIEANGPQVSPTNHNLMPPPPPPAPAPPILRELQHLAMPPPPPPAPLYRMISSSSAPNQPTGTGVIEIVMDNDDDSFPPPNPNPNTNRDTMLPPPPPPPPMAPPSQITPPVNVGLQTLEPRTHSVNHNRGRSITDNSLSGRFSRATERMRSASRGASPQLSRTKSPPISPPMDPNGSGFGMAMASMMAPYESVPTQKWVMEQMAVRRASESAGTGIAAPVERVDNGHDRGDVRERHPREVRANMMMGGEGMI
jgi:hypothetical protein